MTTINETNGTYKDLIDDVASAALALSEWSDADTGVTTVTPGNDSDYTDRGRVLEHGPSGMFVGLFYASSYESGNEYIDGIRCSLSTDWNTTDNIPAGNTDTTEGDPWSSSVGNDRHASFNDVYEGTDFYETPFGCPISESSSYGDTINYFGSVTANFLNIAAWDSNDGSYGKAGYFNFEHTTDQFWASGDQPWTAYTMLNHRTDYDFTYLSASSWRQFYGNSRDNGGDYCYYGDGFDESQWGFINPDSNDDTFFFRRPVIYDAGGTPIAYVESAIKNDVSEGGSHGDTFDYDTETYRVFKQSGASQSQPVSVALRYE
ncbi:hypothetical protein [Natrinema versiforme]|uniref:Uncharacterized protein n=1 Tax=Natrinema versiforme JCM 10478 TaxID=1227496 RepID=L9Y283_9EURY|nr:hypothetical protein [Natrinema versiforme]ELY68140.1 hypothetical protein C489_09060 [Natrinema versiforme JCM 10478]